MLTINLLLICLLLMCLKNREVNNLSYGAVLGFNTSNTLQSVLFWVRTLSNAKIYRKFVYLFFSLKQIFSTKY